MKRLTPVLTCVAVLLLFVLPAAHAQATRTWVSGVGDDANPCSRTAPCKTFAGAISKTAKDGEISVLDPGGFGAVTITKSITISGDGTLAGILSASTNGVIVNITSATDVRKTVILRNISINGAGTGLNGVRFLAGNELTLDNVTIAGVTGNGVDIALTSNGNAYIRNTRINTSLTGIRVTTTTGLARVTLDHVETENLTNGMDVQANSLVNVRDSVFARGNNGALLSAATAVANFDNSTFSHNTGAAISLTAAGAVARISRSSFLNNNIGLNIGAGTTVQSDGANIFAGNTANGTPNGAALLKQ